MTSREEEKRLPHNGGLYPGHEMDAVRPVYRGPPTIPNGIRIAFAPAKRLDWSHDGGDDDIVAYELVKASRQ